MTLKRIESRAKNQRALLTQANNRLQYLLQPNGFIPAPTAPLIEESEDLAPAPAPASAPAPAPQQVVEEPRAPIVEQRVVAVTPTLPRKGYKATDAIPLVSYLNIAFRGCFEPGDELNSWNHLPSLVQLDVLRHISFGCEGKAERFAARHFEDVFKIRDQITVLKGYPKPTEIHGLSREFVEKGEAFLVLYHDRPNGFMNWQAELEKIPKEPRFLHAIYEMALEASVIIESWDTDFARHNWQHPSMIPLTVQALERCLHAST
jgi:hypothetical protein